MKERLCRKQITFDLSDKKLRQYYPALSETVSAQYHKKAWKDIAEFMEQNHFTHRQYSVYVSDEPMSKTAVLYLIRRMVERFPWIFSCLNAMDVTDVGKQHSLMDVIEHETKKMIDPKNIETKKIAMELDELSLEETKKEAQPVKTAPSRRR